MSSSSLLKQLGARRTIYGLSKENFPLANSQVVQLVEDVVAATPSSFNNQTTRAIVLFGDSHDKLWKEIVLKALKAILPADQFEDSAARINGFAAGYGTVLFFEDTETIKEFEQKFPPYAHNFVTWASHSSGAAQINLWTALANENVGANLQHYNELISTAIAKEFNVPASWKLVSQLVFGSKVGGAGEKTTLPGSKVVKVFN